MGLHWLHAELVATVLEVPEDVGIGVRAGESVVLLDSMKMEIPVPAPFDAVVREIAVTVGEVVQAGDPLVAVEAI